MTEDTDPASRAPDPGGGAPPGAPGAPSGVRPLALDPELAAAAARRGDGSPRLPAPVIGTRRYRWVIGGFGLIVLIVVSVVSFLQHGVVTAGVPAHQRLRYFAAPLARSDLDGDANIAHPACSFSEHDPRALNVCLVVKTGPLVLAFFVTGATLCTREVDAMQTVSLRFPGVQFAAVAVHASHAKVASIARLHGWTIPVAYDADGAVGELYGVEVCPLVELAYRGGIVEDRLIGAHWARPAALAQRVHALLALQSR